MTGRGVGALASRTIRLLVAAACGCASRHWKLDISRSIAGVTVRAEIRTD